MGGMGGGMAMSPYQMAMMGVRGSFADPRRGMGMPADMLEAQAMQAYQWESGASMGPGMGMGGPGMGGMSGPRFPQRKPRPRLFCPII